MPDRLTLIAVSALAYVLAVALHEHLGHAAACVLLGSRPLELGAFYVACDNARLGSASMRCVALAGPLVSLVTGLACFWGLPRLRAKSGVAPYFTWLLGCLTLMMAAGYPLFSGISGIGDLGAAPDAALYGLEPEWVYRVSEAVMGGVAYVAVALLSARAIEPLVPGSGPTRLRLARRIALASYLTGGILYLLIGALNPYGLVIVASSALASSLGGTSGLLWMMQLLDRRREVAPPGVLFARSWRWIAVATVATLAYAIVLGPTWKP